MRDRGYSATQATVSRDVSEMGLIKQTREGTRGYAIPPRVEQPETTGEERLATDPARPAGRDPPAGLLLVVKAVPGSAHADRGRAGSQRLAGSRGLNCRRRHGLRCRAPTGPLLDRVRTRLLRLAELVPDRSQRSGGVPSRVCALTGPRLQSPPTRTPGAPGLQARAGDLPISGTDTTMNNKPAYLSKDGLEKIRQELEEMVNVRRAEVASRIHEAKEHGDISENAEYEDAKNEQAFVEGRIQSLSALIKNAVVIEETHSTTHVQIGSTVTLQSDDGKEKFTIVGSAEAAPAEGRISNESPVGRALLGHKKGDTVVVTVPGRGHQVQDRLSISQSVLQAGGHRAGARRRRSAGTIPARSTTGRTRSLASQRSGRWSTTRRRRLALSISAACAA